MFPTYSAVLRAGHLEWEGISPPADPVRVRVTVIAPLVPSPVSGPAMASALAALAAAGGPSGFDDPMEWQRQTRADRSLPGRDEKGPQLVFRIEAAARLRLAFIAR